MAKLYGIHEIELKPGVKEEDFEEFMVEQVYALPWPCEFTLLKGDKGERDGKYLVLMVFESTEARDRWDPVSGWITGEGRRFFQTHAATVEKYEAMATPVGETIYTDYVVLGK
jgi:hypothetical protein